MKDKENNLCNTFCNYNDFILLPQKIINRNILVTHRRSEFFSCYCKVYQLFSLTSVSYYTTNNYSLASELRKYTSKSINKQTNKTINKCVKLTYKYVVSFIVEKF